MQSLSNNMLAALIPRVAVGDQISRNRALIFEIYDSSFLAASDGTIDPSLAIALWAKTSLTWLGNTYQGRIVSHSAIEQFIDGKFNSVTLTLENADRYLSAFVNTNNVNGMRLVARYINIDLSTTLADSVVCFVGRLEAPTGDIDREQGDLTAQEELASLDIETPRRKVSPDDPEGRSPNDLLYEGFSFNARPSSIKYVVSTPTRKFLIFTGHKDQVKYNQWSSVSETDNAVVPLIAGRVQRDGMPVFWTDIGFYIVGIWVYSGHKITSITNFQLPDSNYVFYGIWASPTLQQSHVHLGDPGGTGTNASPDTIENNYPQNTALLSRTGYVGFAIGGPESASQPFANPQMDAVPTLVAIVRGECDLPDSGGVFNQKGFSDSPVYGARFVLTSKDFFGLDPRLVYDGELPSVHAERQRPIVDKSNGEFLALMSHDASALLDGRLTRLNSTGLIDARYFRHIVNPTYPDPLITNRDDVYSVQPGGDGPAGGDQQLFNGAGLAGQTVGSGAWKYYYIDTPVGADQLQITATGSGDGTSFLKLGSKPTLTDFDAFAYSASPQIMTVTNPTAGRWWIGIAGFQPDGTPAAGLSYSIIAIYTNGAAGNVLPIRPAIRKAFTLNVPLTDTSNAIDFLNNVVLASFRGYRITDAAGRQRIRARKASDSAYLMSGAAGGTSATGTATLDALPADSDTLTVNGVLFTFRTAPTSSFEILIGATITATVDTLVSRLNASTDPLLSIATYVNSGSGVLTINHDVGATGNSFTLAKVSSHITLSGATLSGGTDGATSLSVANVEPWIASKQGYVLISVGLVTSETRKVTIAQYNPTIGNAVTLAVSDSSLTRSGATLSGGSTSVPSSGTVNVNSLAAIGTVLTVTVFGIPISYTVTVNDDVNSIAGMLAASINADPNLRQYARAVWNGAHLLTIYCTIGTLGFALGLANAHPAQVASPLTAPTASTTTSGTLIPGNYYLGYALVDGSGNETLMTPLRTIAIAAGQKVSVSSLGSLPSGAAEVNWYFSPAHDDDHVQFYTTNSGGSFTINAVPDPDSDFPPVMNTTGGETIRIMEVFNERNIRKDTFKWVPSKSQTNQVTGTFIDAANGFKPQPITVNDIAHQRAVRKINKKDINLSGVDNFSQASRLCNATLAEERDGGTRWKWATDDAGIPLEIGDVVAVNGNYVDPTGTIQKEWVNVPVMLEATSLQEDFDVGFTGIFYSTSLLEGQTGRKPVVIPTTLKYMTEAPLVATNLVLTLDDTFLTGFIGDFDFGSTGGTQSALIYLKGPSVGSTGTVTLDTLPVDGDTLTVNGVLFTFRTAPTTSFEILIGATINATVNALAVQLSASTDPSLSIATYVNSGSGVLTITSSAGISFTLAKVSSHITLSGATLLDIEPADSTYKLVDTIVPDANNKGHFGERATVGGKYWIKVVTQSQFGKVAASGHPVGTINIRPAAPTHLAAHLDPSGNWFITATGHPRLVEIPEKYMARLRRPSDGVTMRNIEMRPGDQYPFVSSIFFGGTGTGSIINNSIKKTNNTGYYAAESAQQITGPGVKVIARAFNIVSGSTAILQFDVAPSGSAALAQISAVYVDANTTAVSCFVTGTAPVNVNLPTVGGQVWLAMSMVGDEFRFFAAASGDPTTKPAIAVGKNSLTAIPVFPLCVGIFVDGPTNTAMDSVTISGLLDPATVYSLDQEKNDNGGSGLTSIDVEMWQEGVSVPGESVRHVFP